jgi:hypothetical protein
MIKKDPQDTLGHTNIRTPENYLDSFEKEMKKEYASKLMAIKREFLPHS